MDKKTFENEDLNDEICIIIGTRPGIVMFAPVIHELKKHNQPFFVLHTGQHYSPELDKQICDDLNVPVPEYRIEGTEKHTTHASQTAHMMVGIEKILMERRPKMVIVNGDANTNLAGALVARKLNMILCHMEAGNRCYNWRMPEEHNRVIMDAISDLLFASDATGVAALKHENVNGEIHLTGNTVVDASLQNLEIALEKSTAFEQFNVKKGEYALLTMHREENVDHPVRLKNSLQGVANAAEKIGVEVLFLAHPRTVKRLEQFGLTDWVKSLPNIRFEKPVGFLDFIALLSQAKILFTDSGGGQQEACIHHIPCVTVKDTSEWPDTVTIGANHLAGNDPELIVQKALKALSAPRDWEIPFGDGTAAKQIVEIMLRAIKNPPRILEDHKMLKQEQLKGKVA